MRAYRTLTPTLARSMLREPVGLFFTVLFAPLLVLGLGLIFGNDPTPQFGGKGYVEASLPAFAALVTTIMGVMSLPVSLVNLRESGALTRLRLTPLAPRTFVASDLTVNFLVGLVGMALAFLVGVVVFGVRPAGSVGLVLVASGLGLAAFLALGYTFTALYPSSAAATAIGNVLMIALMLTSGAFVPLEVMPAGIQAVMRFSPVHHLVELLDGLWNGHPWSAHLLETGVLVGMVAVFGALGARLFRWR